LHPDYRHGKPKEFADYDHSATRPFLVVQSAHDQNTLTKNIVAHQSVVDKYYLADFAHTMNTKRTRLGHRAFAVVTQGSETSDMDPTTFQSGVARKSIPDLAFIFTGQGAAWAGVAVEALEHFPVFAASICNLDKVLRTIEHPADFSIYEELLASPENSRINHPKYSQPILVAIELALVDLFASWDIVPKATVGHSAGEYAAAYAAGLASAPEIIIAAYYRGYCLDKYAPSGGSMLAVGVGADEVSELLPSIGTELVVACENSPKSVTLSGPVEVIKAAKAILDEASVFARELTTGMAYHSPAMNPVAKPMIELVTSAWQKLDNAWLSWRRPRCAMFSSVDNSILKMGRITPSYWAQNLTGRVRFPQAVAALAKHPKNDKLKVFVELGPHSALAGPFKQILEAEQIKGAVHVPSFVRKQNSAVRLLKTAGQLFIENYPVDFDQVNEVTLPFSSRKRMVPLTLVDLPSYQWQYEKQYWAENRTSSQHRAITHARHDVLGRRIPGVTKSSFVWSNRLRNKDLPWLQDHKLGGDIMFPAAGHMAAAIEATRQLCELRTIDMKGVQLRDIDISNALVIPNDEDGIQIQVRLTEVSVGADSLPSFQFVLESIVDDVEKIHSTGKVVPLLEERADESYEAHPVDLTKLNRRQSGNRWYEALREVGFDYGPSFNDLQSVRSSGKGREAAASLHVRQSNPVMQDESRYMLHPSTVDACLQLIIISIHRGMAENLPWGVVPVKIEQASFWPLDADSSSLGQAVAWTSERDGRLFNTHTKLKSSTGKLVLDITGLQCIMYEAAIPVQKTVMPEQQPYSMSKWDIDVDASVFADIPWTTSGQNALMDLVKLVNHKASPSTAAIVGSVEDDVMSAFKDAIPNVSNMILYRPNVPRDSEPIQTNGITNPKSSGYKSLIESQSQPHNLVIADLTDLKYDDTVSRSVLTYITNMVEETGRIVGLITPELLQATKETFDSTKLTLKTESLEDLVLFYATPIALTTAPAALTLFCVSNAETSSNELVEELRKHNITVEVTALSEYSANCNNHAVIYDPAGTILTMLDKQSWKGLQDILSSGRLVTWLTKGVNELTSVDGGSAQGFLRVLRAEDPAAKLDLLDIDSASSPLSVTTALKYLASRDFEQASETGIADTEFWLHDGQLLCLRVESATKVNSTMALGKQQTSTRQLTDDAVLIGSLSDTGLTFQNAEPVVLNADQVEVRVTHEGLSRSDNGPRFVAGIVTRVGHNISGEAKNQHVVVASSQSFNTVIRAAWNECVVCPEKNIATVIKELPMVISAVNALQHVSPDHHVYLLPMEPANRDALLLAAHAMNLHVDSIESGAPAKRVEAVMQAAASQRKVAVIAQEFENYAQEVWRSTPAGSYFVVNEGAISSVLDPLPLTRGAVFRSTSMKTLWKSHPQYLNSILRSTVQIIGDSASQDQATVPHTVNVNQFSSDPKAHALATVLTYGYGQDQVLVSPFDLKETRLMLTVFPD
jgi:malonyl CoA-acyl carrier protein transacylase